MVISEWEIEIEDCCIDNFWDGKEYYVSHKYIQKEMKGGRIVSSYFNCHNHTWYSNIRLL